MSEDVECSRCGETFESAKGLHIHQTKVHGEILDDASGPKNINSANTKLEFSGLKPWMLILLGFLIGISTIFALYHTGFILDDDEETITGQVWEDQITIEDRHTEGSENAPVTLYIYQDYTCPGCSIFQIGNETQEQSILEKIRSDFVDSGDAKIVWKNYPSSEDSESYETAIAMECVRRESESAFPVIANRVLDNQSEDTVQKILSESNDLMEGNQIENCIENSVTDEIVKTDLKEAQMFELEHPPSMIIDDGIERSYWRVHGLKNTDYYENVIEEALNSHEARAN